MASLLSPGVISREIDLTTATPAVASTEGGIVINSQWGPSGKLVLLSDETDLVNVYGKPNDVNYARWFSAKNFLSYSGALYVSRAIGSDFKNSTSGTDAVLIENKEKFDEKLVVAAEGFFAARYSGVIGNSLKVVVVDESTWEASTYSSNFLSKPDTDELHIAVIDEDGLFSGQKGTVLEKFEYVSKFGDAVRKDGSTNYYKKRVNESSEYIYILDDLKPEFGAVTSDWVTFDSSTGKASIVSLNSGDKISRLNSILLGTAIDDNPAGTPEVLYAAGDQYTFPNGGPTVTLEAGATTDINGVDVPHDGIIGVEIKTPAVAAGDELVDSYDTVTALSTYEISLKGGVGGDGKDSDGNDRYVNESEIVDAYKLFVDEEAVDISFLICAGDPNLENNTTNEPVKAIIQEVYSIVSTRQDCMGVISPLRLHVIGESNPETKIEEWRDDINVGSLRDLKGSFMVMDDNWKYQFDKYNNVNRWVPCNGDVAGLMSENDRERAPWISPGGRSLKNVIKLAWKSTKAQRDVLYPLGVNSITTFPGEGAILYGDRTMLKRPSAFDRINVRRLFIVLRKSISTTARSFLFENNTSYTRERFKSTVIPFLEDVQGRQGISDFLVVCDDTNNTGQVIDQNRFVGDIYVKPSRSINFIELNFVAVRTDVEFSEVVGSI